MILQIISNQFPTHISTAGLCNADRVCLLQGRNWFIIYLLHRLGIQFSPCQASGG